MATIDYYMASAKIPDAFWAMRKFEPLPTPTFNNLKKHESRLKELYAKTCLWKVKRFHSALYPILWKRYWDRIIEFACKRMECALV